MRKSVKETARSVRKLRDAGILIDDITVSYTLMSDDVTRGEKPQGTPYLSRRAKFDENFYSAETGATLSVKEREGAFVFLLKTEREDLSEFGLNLPFNFMGKKNAGGWKNQYLFNSPYASENNGLIYCYFTSPGKESLMLSFDSPADGWKMDYSLFLGGHYFDNLKALANFDRAYGTGSHRKTLRLSLFACKDLEDGLAKLAERRKIPALYYGQNGGQVGSRVRIRVFGECDSVRCGRKTYTPENGRFDFTIGREGTSFLVPYYRGKRGYGASLYGWEDLFRLWKKTMDSVTEEDLAFTDGNLCEHQCWVSAMLRYMMRFGANKKYERAVKKELAAITARDEKQALPRQTIWYKPHGGFPAYNVYESGRMQEQFFGVTILLDAYRYFGIRKYLDYAVRSLKSVLRLCQKEDGRLARADTGEDYTTVCCPMITVCDMANFLKDKDEKSASYFRDAAAKMAAYLFGRGMNFPTEGGVSDLAETEMEEGSISCTALALLYYCAHIERRDEYIAKAKEIMDVHDKWVIGTPLAPMFFSTLRWWETKWEGDEDGNALCCGHAWTIWRAEADYWYAHLTGDREYLRRARNGFASNFAKTDKKGKMYSVFQPDYITGGGFTDRCEQVEFRIARGFPRRSDSGLSRYAWLRAAESLFNDGVF